jgi:hypothetical protein
MVAVTSHTVHVDRKLHMAAATTGSAPGAHGKLHPVDTRGGAAETELGIGAKQRPHNTFPDIRMVGAAQYRYAAERRRLESAALA